MAAPFATNGIGSAGISPIDGQPDRILLLRRSCPHPSRFAIESGAKRGSLVLRSKRTPGIALSIQAHYTIGKSLFVP
jgi:hypothetical protein